MKDGGRNSIDHLFEGVEDVLDSPTRVLPAIRLTPSPEALEAAKVRATQKANEEKREFTRAEVTAQQIQVRFSNDQQFARQYVENISLGGLFLKTPMRPGVGNSISLSLSVPTSAGELKEFVLKAKVCRESESGLGLQFQDLTTDVRRALEDIVRAALPEGTPLANQVKRGSVDHLEQMRLERMAERKRRMKTAKTTLTIGILLLLNLYMGLEVMEIQDVADSTPTTPTLKVGSNEISTDRIRSIARNASGKIEVRLIDNSVVVFDLSEIDESQLAPHLRESLRVVRTLQPPKHVRKIKNPPRANR